MSIFLNLKHFKDNFGPVASNWFRVDPYEWSFRLSLSNFSLALASIISSWSVVYLCDRMSILTNNKLIPIDFFWQFY